MTPEQAARFNALMAPYRAQAVVAIPMDDEPIHSFPEHPFCQDMTCPCHDDKELIREYLSEPWQAGLMTNREADRLYHGQQIR